MQKKAYSRKLHRNEDPRQFAFRMPEAMAEAYLNSRADYERKKDIGDYLCEIVNDHMGGYYKGTCVKVIVV